VAWDHGDPMCVPELMSDHGLVQSPIRRRTYRPAALVLCMGLLAPLLATGALDWAFAQLISRPPLFIERPMLALLNFIALAAPFGFLAARGADVDPLDQPRRSLGLLAGGVVGAWVVLMIYGYLLITTFLTPSLGAGTTLNLWAELLVLFAPVLIFLPMYGVSEMIGGEAHTGDAPGGGMQARGPRSGSGPQ